MNPVNTLKRVVKDADATAQLLAEVREGIANQSALINRKMNELISLQRAQFEATAALVRQMGGQVSDPAHFQKPPSVENIGDSRPSGSFKEAMERIPLLLDEKTYNTAHPDYDATKVRNYPGRIFNYDKPCSNVVYKALQAMVPGKKAPKDISDGAWAPMLKEIMAEAKSVPHAGQVFERKEFIEHYMRDLGDRYGAHYVPGWVNLEDALFLYWMIRQLKPKTVVQTGVSNGLSSAFMMLALAKNGPEGKLHVIDLPAIFDPKDPAWTVRDKVYGVVIPEGKSSGWMVPDAYRDRFEVRVGDAKQLLPKLVDELPAIDMFYHDSDHTYNHMMFEFKEAKRKLTPGGLIIGDDISWNASVWDFADQYGVPSYNYKGAVGVAFF